MVIKISICGMPYALPLNLDHRSLIIINYYYEICNYNKLLFSGIKYN